MFSTAEMSVCSPVLPPTISLVFQRRRAHPVPADFSRSYTHTAYGKNQYCNILLYHKEEKILYPVHC